MKGDPQRLALTAIDRRFASLRLISPVALRRVRIFHVLSDHDVRTQARQYIDP